MAAETPNPPTPPRRPGRSWIVWVLVGLVTLGASIWLGILGTGGAGPEQLSLSQFLSDVTRGTVSTATIQADGQTSGTLSDGSSYSTVIPATMVDDSLLTTLRSNHVEVTAVAASSLWSTIGSWAFTLLPIALLVWFWWRLSRSQGSAQGLFGAGKSPAKLFRSTGERVTFASVAGYPGVKAEVAEVVDFLAHPQRYRELGAVTPRGILMIGPPGTGKTLLARAVAGEAQVPFFSVDGSSFVEMFVGVGAARVRDLFKEARSAAPSIIFIDEIDAIGQRRSGPSSFVSNDERDQTLNQLLSELDGFDSQSGVVVLAATNRPDVLDEALLRPGRFDRRIVVPLPQLSDRRAILAVHCATRPLDPEVDLDAVARSTPGFAGADLANLVNEAAIEAVRNGHAAIMPADVDAARDRVILGRRDRSTVLTEEEKRAVAFHEAGHAIVAALSPHADPVEKVTILPMGESLGSTHQLPEGERHLLAVDTLEDMLAVRLGGRAAELVAFGQGSSGGSADLVDATRLAVRMVREFGLSPKVGPVSYSEGETALDRRFSDETQRAIDSEVRRLLDEAQRHAVTLLTAHRPALDALAERLIRDETVDGETVYETLHVSTPASIVHPKRAGATDAVPAARDLAATQPIDLSGLVTAT